MYIQQYGDEYMPRCILIVDMIDVWHPNMDLVIVISNKKMCLENVWRFGSRRIQISHFLPANKYSMKVHVHQWNPPFLSNYIYIYNFVPFIVPHFESLIHFQDVNFESWVQAWLGYPLLNLGNPLQRLSNSPFSSLFPRHVLHFTLLSHVKWNIFFQILCKHLKYLLFSLMKMKILNFIQCEPCSINGPKFAKNWFFETFYIAIGHLILVTFMHFIHINT